MINDTVKAKGELHIVLRDANGNIKDERKVPNMVVTVGKNLIASRLVGTASTVMSHMEIGTSATAPVAGNTTLGAAVAGSRTALTSSTNVNADVTYVATFGPTVGTGAITEAGIFNAPTGGTMLARTTFLVVNKAAEDSLTISWKVTIS